MLAVRHLVMPGAPLKAVQELLGHATIMMTMRYAHLAPEIARDAVRLLDGRGKTMAKKRRAELSSRNNGGGGGSRTRVRKCLRTNFYACRLAV